MRIGDTISRLFIAPELTRKRIWFAFTVAGLTDALQLTMGFLGWLGLDEVLDLIAMILICASLGFHMLLLPTFVIELFPVADMLPTWTGCTAAVVLLRRKTQSQSSPLPAKMATPTPPIITDLPAPARASWWIRRSISTRITVRLAKKLEVYERFSYIRTRPVAERFLLSGVPHPHLLGVCHRTLF